ncbi:Uncharacterised protein [Actinobacillus ureae]|uniref:Uncharacterized protein n=1 Tax=Actinobacillus ureae ATCC 25976 TaxID=887324 RepID=E8KH39_9PAST|nr:hypothetical protein [Actinobacillus ureae]EFX91783.1 hypothetical protein HMPREF0027_1156 [Actinobacillus ureae ATCC 25976]SUT86203.1 Uncharacterised protein [Actinobacillus ureae]SUU45099.1 Uncharacterised protein [Actinobacillus ureae]
MQPQVEVPEPIEERVKEVLVKEEFIVDFNTVRKVQVVEEEEEDISEFEQAFMNAISMKSK